MSPETINFLINMAHSPAHNYVIPGLTSWLIGSPHPEHGCVRMFEMSRVHEEPIIPHSHRFDFRCIVLRGEVNNHIWYENEKTGDEYTISDVTYEGKLGVHNKTELRTGRFSRKIHTYLEGDEYAMKAEQFHSIYFSKGAVVLFFEGPNRLEKSQVLEPYINYETIPLFKTEPWMFKR